MKLRKSTRVWVLAGVGALLGCASNDVSRFAAATPVLELERFFDGPATAVGTVSDRSGNVTRRFRAKAESTWSEAEQALTVKETWYWDDGEVEPRLWRWEKKTSGLWKGFEDDVTGEAIGRAAGNTVHWTYTMGVNTSSYGRLNVFADDVMHLVDADNIINLVDMYVYGFYVGQVVLHIQRGQGRDVQPYPSSGVAGAGASE